MLQQTQVATVIPYFRRFVEKYTNPAELARAPLDDVLALWSGLGYYSRARNLHRAAALCVEMHGGDLPRDFDALAALPGIGRSTAGAILAQAHGLRFPILDGNVKRVLARWRGVRGWPGGSAVAARLWSIAQQQTPHERVADYTQAIMDLGAGVCTRARPRCDACPLADDCVARRDNLTAELPQRKPARALPTRSTVMLVLRDASGRILLERRPSTGVWAGLWSLPEAADVAAAHREVARHADTGPAAAHGKSGSQQPAGFLPLPSFVHGFSHFRLQVMPLQRHVPAASVVHDGDERRWLHLRDAQALGLPAPVRKLIASLEETPR